jgi:hypothetical protein
VAQENSRPGIEATPLESSILMEDTVPGGHVLETRDRAITRQQQLGVLRDNMLSFDRQSPGSALKGHRVFSPFWDSFRIV